MSTTRLPIIGRGAGEVSRGTPFSSLHTRFLERDLVPGARRALARFFPGIIRPAGFDLDRSDLTHSELKPCISDAEFLGLIKGAGEGAENPLSLFDSGLSLGRRAEILEEHLVTAEARKQWRMHVRKQEYENDVPLTPDSIREPQWATRAPALPATITFDATAAVALADKIAQLNRNGIEYRMDTTDGTVRIEIRGTRAMVAFHKVPCPYQCGFCLLPDANNRAALYREQHPVDRFPHDQIGPDTQLQAFEQALLQSGSLENRFPFIEVLNDGSWYSRVEIPDETRNRVTRRIAELDHVQVFAVESRPDYIDELRVREDLDRLRPDQQLRIYIGLETTDDLIASVSRKWYGWAEFERSVRTLAALPDQDRRRLEIVAYNFMKMWNLSDAESLDESVRLVERISRLSRETGVAMHVKHEPTVVTKGTDQHWAFHQIDENGERRYKNLSYFTVAELVSRLHARELATQVAFGQRDDIDNIEITPMVARPGSDSAFSPLDHIVYHAVQQFQSDHNIQRFFARMRAAVFAADGRLTHEYESWEKEVCDGNQSSLRGYLEAETDEPLSPEDRAVIAHDLYTGTCKSSLESDPNLQQLAATDPDKLEKEIAARFTADAAKHGYCFVFLRKVIHVDIGKDDVGTPQNEPEKGCQVEAVLTMDHNPANVWLFIPAKMVQTIPEVRYRFESDGLYLQGT